jgi:hypothetical protein
MSILIVRTKEKPPYAYQLKYDGKTIYIRLLDSETYRTKIEFEVYRSKEDKKIYLIEREFLNKTSVKERKYFYKGERIPSVENADPFELFNLISSKKGKLIETKSLNNT